MATGTATRTGTITLTDVKHVMWRICSDLRVLRVHHNMMTQEREEEFAEDLLLWIFRNYASTIEFSFYDAGSNTRRFAVKYAIDRAWGGDDQDSGGLRYADVTGTQFRVTVSTNDDYGRLSSADLEGFHRALKMPWPTQSVRLTDGQGFWTSDRSYGSNGLGVARSVFRSP